MKNRSKLSTIERIQITRLVDSSVTSNQGKYQWKTLDCRLSCERHGCAAAVVHDRFIVVAGGEKEHNRCNLSSVDIIDTTTKSKCFVISGPKMNVARSYFKMDVISSRIYAVGGWVYDSYDEEDGPYDMAVGSIEFLDVDDWLKKGHQSATSMSTSTKSWQMDNNLVLRSRRFEHGMVRVGSCLVVVGGSTFDDTLYSVEVLDTQRNIVWDLPELRGYVFGAYNVVAISTGMVRVGSCLVVVGGSTFDDTLYSVEVLDTQRNIVWDLPELRGYVFGAYNVVAISTGIIAIKVWYNENADDPGPIS